MSEAQELPTLRQLPVAAAFVPTEPPPPPDEDDVSPPSISDESLAPPKLPADLE
jgi:hypothetical protein